jgi:hypothetical protein
MDYKELLKKYHLLEKENARLTDENNILKAKLGIATVASFPNHPEKTATQKDPINDESTDKNSDAKIDKTSDSLSKIRLFMSLFKGRSDVYARRWKNKHNGKSGYTPVCLNQWRPGICGKPEKSCLNCKHKLYAPLDEDVIEDHLRGEMVVGIYPMLADETCCCLAMDFDGAEWQKDVSTLTDVCNGFTIPVAIERSRSGNGGHAWFFFETPLSAAMARKFGTALLTYSMNKRHEITFKSYDRLFPSQDTLPKGGLGNLIALPLQKAARKNMNSEFIDNNFHSFSDQWAFLSTIQKISENRIEDFISALCPGHELGVLKIDTEETNPWEPHTDTIKLHKNDFPGQIDIVKSNMLFVSKAGISQKALNRLKRLASFKNPMFYKQQAMRLPTYGHPRVISCADETRAYLCLPRGCEPELTCELESIGTDTRFIDKTFCGKQIHVTFNGHLRDEQLMALNCLLQHDNGILSGTTAFGKTVVAIGLIAEKKVNTLILVNKINLLSQWKEKLSEFLIINESLPKQPPDTVKKKGRKKKNKLNRPVGKRQKHIERHCGYCPDAVAEPSGRSQTMR